MHETGNQQARVLVAVLCGLPGSGKTSLCKDLARVAVQHEVAVHHLCLDALLEQFTTSTKVQSPHEHDSSYQAAAQSTAAAGTAGQAAQQHAAAQQHGELPFTAEAWQASRQRLLQETQLLLQQQEVLQQQRHGQQRVLLLVDDINHYRSMRYECVQLARTHGAAFLQIYMDCPMELALQRNSQRQGSGVVPAAVVAQLVAAFEQPQPDKHHWEAGATLTVHCSSSQITYLRGWPPLPAVDNGVCDATTASGAAGEAGSLAEAVWCELQAAWGPPLQPPPSGADLASRRAAGSAANAASALHALDLASRSLLHDTLAACAQDKRAGAAAALNAQRKQLLEQLRQQQQQQAGPAAGSGTAAGGGHVQQLMDAFKQLCAEYA